jgi:hypothetical protein
VEVWLVAGVDGVRHGGVMVTAICLAVLAGVGVTAWEHLVCSWSGDDIGNLTLWIPSGDSHYSQWTSSRSSWNSGNTKVDFVLIPFEEDELVTGETHWYGDTGWDGLCYVWYSNQTLIMSRAEAYLNYYYSSGYESNKVRSVAAHELGHAVGLDDVYNDVEAVMIYNTYDRYEYYEIYTPVDDDFDGVNWKYGWP